MDMYGKVVPGPCSVTNELTAYSHTSMMTQNTLIPLVEDLSLMEKIAEDNKAAWVTLTVTQMPAPLYGAVHLRAAMRLHQLLQILLVDR